VDLWLHSAMCLHGMVLKHGFRKSFTFLKLIYVFIYSLIY
jgi:hypothetical protein